MSLICRIASNQESCRDDSFEHHYPAESGNCSRFRNFRSAAKVFNVFWVCIVFTRILAFASDWRSCFPAGFLVEESYVAIPVVQNFESELVTCLAFVSLVAV